MRWAVFDELVGRATQDETDVRLAREEWSAQTGRVHPDHELYGERSDAFVEWYVLDRRGVDGLTAVERALLPTAPRPSVDGTAAVSPIDNVPGGVIDKGLDRATCLALRAAHRSLFFVRELQPGGARVDEREPQRKHDEPVADLPAARRRFLALELLEVRGTAAGRRGGDGHGDELVVAVRDHFEDGVREPVRARIDAHELASRARAVRGHPFAGIVEAARRYCRRRSRARRFA